MLISYFYVDIKSIEKGLAICKKSAEKSNSSSISVSISSSPSSSSYPQAIIATDPRKRSFVTVGGI